MKTLRVVNKGKKARYRLGVEFPPNQTVEITVSNREYLTVKAVRDFEVEIVSEDDKSEAKHSHESAKTNAPSLDVQSMTIDEVLEAVKEGKLSVDEALSQEKAGKKRSTLIDKLESLKEA
ncbi:hypothetical protein [Geobacillus stearothermophilus]|uniref:hypothetical protein n=1 Tax=Geobacillus stearothermophilus TaxID=1422 RepID=UPI00066FC939|nr:hypothetical protein [Geobacillus stearothermophilus]KMY60114.1 hypothetical protein AA906_06970 [Geobacillus stearothermophilus]MED3746683.1 hypothetical protein [Geobacillus stearothermophilus]MED3754144.1 hypothetical protein [Geobacillus stearothermophilus]